MLLFPYTLGYNGYASKVSFSTYGEREREREKHSKTKKKIKKMSYKD